MAIIAVIIRFYTYFILILIEICSLFESLFLWSLLCISKINPNLQTEGKFWTHWIPETKQFFIQFHYKVEKAGESTKKVLISKRVFFCNYLSVCLKYASSYGLILENCAYITVHSKQRKLFYKSVLEVYLFSARKCQLI